MNATTRSPTAQRGNPSGVTASSVLPFGILRGFVRPNWRNRYSAPLCALPLAESLTAIDTSV